MIRAGKPKQIRVMMTAFRDGLQSAFGGKVRLGDFLEAVKVSAASVVVVLSSALPQAAATRLRPTNRAPTRFTRVAFMLWFLPLVGMRAGLPAFLRSRDCTHRVRSLRGTTFRLRERFDRSRWHSDRPFRGVV